MHASDPFLWHEVLAEVLRKYAGKTLPREVKVSRCVIAAWASRTWAFDSANVLPP